MSSEYRLKASSGQQSGKPEKVSSVAQNAASKNNVAATKMPRGKGKSKEVVISISTNKATGASKKVLKTGKIVTGTAKGGRRKSKKTKQTAKKVKSPGKNIHGTTPAVNDQPQSIPPLNNSATIL